METNEKISTPRNANAMIIIDLMLKSYHQGSFIFISSIVGKPERICLDVAIEDASDIVDSC